MSISYKHNEDVSSDGDTCEYHDVMGVMLQYFTHDDDGISLLHV